MVGQCIHSMISGMNGSSNSLIVLHGGQEGLLCVIVTIEWPHAFCWHWFIHLPKANQGRWLSIYGGVRLLAFSSGVFTIILLYMATKGSSVLWYDMGVHPMAYSPTGDNLGPHSENRMISKLKVILLHDMQGQMGGTTKRWRDGRQHLTPQQHQFIFKAPGHSWTQTTGKVMRGALVWGWTQGRGWPQSHR